MVGSKRWKVGLLYVLAFAVLFVMVFPYLYMVLGSLSPWNEVDRKLIPSSLTLRSYEWLFQGEKMSCRGRGFGRFSTVCSSHRRQRC